MIAHVVKFKDGKYGLRRLNIWGWEFLCLQDYSTWYHKPHKVLTYCHGNYSNVVNINNKIRDFGSYSQRKCLQTKTVWYRLLGYGMACVLIGISSQAMTVLGTPLWERLIYSILSIPVYLLVWRGTTVEEKVIFIESGWDK